MYLPEIWDYLIGPSYLDRKKQSIKPSELQWTDVKDRIYPMLKQAVPESDTTQIIELKTNENPVFDNYIADVHVFYSIDFESFFTYINQGQLIKWKITKDSLSKTALKNLDNLASGRAQFQGDSAFAMIILNGNLEASLMLSDAFWTYIADVVKNNSLIIGIPTRDVLLVTHSDCKEGLEKMRKSVKQTFEQGDHVITKWTFKRENGKWIKFEYIE